jgi:hypothetical protein
MTIYDGYRTIELRGEVPTERAIRAAYFGGIAWAFMRSWVRTATDDSAPNDAYWAAKESAHYARLALGETE